MKVLFITFFFPPYNTIGSVRTGNTAKILHDMGIDIKVIAGKEEDLNKDLPIKIPTDYIYYEKYFDIHKFFLKLLRKDVKEIKKVTHSGINDNFKTKIYKKISTLYKYIFFTPDRYIGWYPYAYRRAEDIIKVWKPDIIYASAMPFTSLLLGSRLSKKYGIPFVAELRDLWIDNHYSKHNLLSKYLEKYALNQASAIITVSEPLAERLKERYRKPIHVIKNAFDEEEFINLIQNKRNQVEGKKLIITYTGSLYAGKQDPSLLFKIISKNEDLKNKVICKFYGDNLEWLNILAKEFDIVENVQVHPKVSRAEALKIQAESDILLLLTWNDPRELGVYTGKLFEYIGNAKPILAIGNKENVASQLINNYGFGIAENDPVKLKEFILNCDKKDFLQIINENYKKYRYLFERKHEVAKLIKIFENVLSGMEK
ncbi:MAG: glycosyltransferase family 4 protein [Hydrogenothermaceae bacterium]|nr:glycosyltransferase family 4 protein [Hydrogenothermaceae bacterium]